MTTNEKAMAVGERDLVSSEEFQRQVTIAHEKAVILKDIVEKQHLYVQVGKGKHLRVEGWITLAQGYGYTCKTRSEPLLSEGTYLGAKAYAEVIDLNGIIRGGADSYCLRDEKGKDEQTFAQLAGMAQTRAESRAYRELLSWVVILAGYSPTPYEEIQGTPLEGQLAGQPQQTDAHWCTEHKVKWFKLAKMQGYAHPIKDAKGKEVLNVQGKPAWCDEVKTVQTIKDVPTEAEASASGEPPFEDYADPGTTATAPAIKVGTNYTLFWSTVKERGYIKDEVEMRLGCTIPTWLKKPENKSKTLDDVLAALPAKAQKEG